ncbi:hypothetical protein HQ865_16875 [Mucilaginibacter mali]|uniref:Uncharacterized protein n=1 Tax=Mucilaginibacter mali TaxID=2740462 RepID=A0A7D4QCZ8_9SPHI|nr:hypothetical protein [Mucilaginibacter mali]QKJ31364.1 hypothetical protein HQ865_16875 [Mucilaginibacter mali]
MSQLITPDWDNANDYTRLDKHVIEIPMDGAVNWQSDLKAGSTGKTNTFKNYSRTSFLIFGSAENYTAYIMTVIADSAYINNDFTKLSQNTFQHHDPNFSGKLLYFTPKGKFVSGWIYKKGKLTAALTSTGTKQTNSLKLLDGPVGTDPTQDGDGSSGGSGNCTYWYYVLRYGNDIISVTLLGRTCDGSVPQGPVDGQYIYPDQTGGYVPPEPVRIIEDSLKKHFPCATKLVIDKLLMDPAYLNFVSVFTTSQKPDLKWEDSNTLPWNQSIPGSTSTTYTLASTTPDNRNATISLNRNMLQNSSQLLIAAAAIHETLHAYINYVLYNAVDSLVHEPSVNSWMASAAIYYDFYYYNLPMNYRDHFAMINDYFDQAVAILATWDNNGHTMDEYRMAMLYGTNLAEDSVSQFEKNLLNTAYNGIVSKYNLSPTAINTFNTNNLNAPTNKKLPGDCPP